MSYFCFCGAGISGKCYIVSIDVQSVLQTNHLEFEFLKFIWQRNTINLMQSAGVLQPFSRAFRNWRQCHLSPHLASVSCFPAPGPLSCFPVLGALLWRPVLNKASCMYSSLAPVACLSSDWSIADYVAFAICDFFFVVCLVLQV